MEVIAATKDAGVERYLTTASVHVSPSALNVVQTCNAVEERSSTELTASASAQTQSGAHHQNS